MRWGYRRKLLLYPHKLAILTVETGENRKEFLYKEKGDSHTHDLVKTAGIRECFLCI